MLKKRIIPCLDIKDGRTVKGVNFLELKDAGNPVELALKYSLAGADELVFLDITATIEGRKTMVELVRKVAAAINIPFTVGGGITSLEDAKAMINAGADKIGINSAAIKNPNLIAELSKDLGSQCVVVAVDTKMIEGIPKVVVHGGRTVTEWNTIDWVKKAEALGAGEILLTSMGSDGTKAGFDLEITELVCQNVNLPVIASGGAGSINDFVDLFQKTKATGGLAASIFHYNEIPIADLKSNLKSKNISIR